MINTTDWVDEDKEELDDYEPSTQDKFDYDDCDPEDYDFSSN